MDRDKAIIERRFNDFEKLHTDLKAELPESIRNINFPKRRFFISNFSDKVIEERVQRFQKYLNFIFHQDQVKDTVAFKSFFYNRHLHNASCLLNSWDYEASCKEFILAYNLQKKLEDDISEIIPTLCGLVEVYKNLKDYEKINYYGLECLRMLDEDLSNPYLLPLIFSLKEARQHLSLDVQWLQQKYKECKELIGIHDRRSIKTLRELTSKRF